MISETCGVSVLVRQTGLRQWKSVGSLIKLSADHALKFSLAEGWRLEELRERPQGLTRVGSVTGATPEVLETRLT